MSSTNKILAAVMSFQNAECVRLHEPVPIVYYILLRSSTALLKNVCTIVHNEHCIAGAVLPIHMAGEVSWAPKTIRALGLLQ